mgnify:FL=1
MGELPIASIIIPCRNVVRFIRNCLGSMIANDYPKEMLEVLEVDGMSEDETREVIGSYAQKQWWCCIFC